MARFQDSVAGHKATDAQGRQYNENEAAPRLYLPAIKKEIAGCDINGQQFYMHWQDDVQALIRLYNKCGELHQTYIAGIFSKQIETFITAIEYKGATFPPTEQDISDHIKNKLNYSPLQFLKWQDFKIILQDLEPAQASKRRHTPRQFVFLP